MTAVWEHSQATGNDRLVLLALADNANDEWECWPSIKTIAHKCRIDTRTTQRRIRSLEELGEVLVIRGGGHASTIGGTRSNRYRIVIHIPSEEGGGNLPGSDTDARGGVAPLPGGGVAPLPPEPSLRTVNEPNPLASASPSPEGMDVDDVFEAVLSECGWDAGSLTPSARGSVNKAIHDLRGVGATAEQVRARCARYRSTYPSAKLTPPALAKHWPALGESTLAPVRDICGEFVAYGEKMAHKTAEQFAGLLGAKTKDPDEIESAWDGWNAAQSTEAMAAV